SAGATAAAPPPPTLAIATAPGTELAISGAMASTSAHEISDRPATANAVVGFSVNSSALEESPKRLRIKLNRFTDATDTTCSPHLFPIASSMKTLFTLSNCRDFNYGAAPPVSLPIAQSLGPCLTEVD